MKKRIALIFVFNMFLIPIIFILVGCTDSAQLAKASKNISEYKIDVKIDDQSMQLLCNQEVVFVNNYSVVLDEVCFNLYVSAYREGAKVVPYTSANQGKVFPNGINYGGIDIKSVMIDGKSADYEIVGQDENALKVKFKKNVEPQEKIKIEIVYDVKLTESTHRLGYFGDSINLGNFFPILAIYKQGEFIIDPYYSTGDPFYSDLANYKVKVEYPNDYNIATTGEIEQEINLKQVNIAQCSALAVRDFAIFLTKNACVQNKTVDKTQIAYVGYENDSNIQMCIDAACKSLAYFNKTFGKYPYSCLTVVKAPFVHGGMEYPNVVVISDSLTEEIDIVKVIVHEIAHQWWYGLVGNNEIDEAWLDESLAEYSTALFFKSHPEYGLSYEEIVNQATAMYCLYADIVNTVQGNIKTSMKLKVNEYNSEYEYSYMIYVKGVIMFDNLREIIGEKKLLACFKRYFKNYKYEIVTTDDLIATFKKTSGRDIEGFFDSWLSGQAIVGNIS